MAMRESTRVDEIGNMFDRAYKPVLALALRLDALNREVPNNPLYTRALAEISPIPDKLTRYSSLFWDAATILKGGPEVERTQAYFESEMRDFMSDILDPLGLFRKR